MKLVFIDEFKCPTKVGEIKGEWYGLVAIVIDSYYYEKFKKGLNQALDRLDWKGGEIKGRYVYSKQGDADVSIEERIKFVKELFSLSTTKSQKNAVIHTYISSQFFERSVEESKQYAVILKNVVNKIDQPHSKKGDKGLIAFFLDDNECLELPTLTSLIEENIRKRNYLLERPFLVHSSNLTPGIIMADFVCYCYSSIIQQKEFSEATHDRFVSLLGKLHDNTISQEDKAILEGLINNHRKMSISSELLDVLKRVVYVK